MIREKVKSATIDGHFELSRAREFWGTTSEWPRNSGECIFLAEAVHAIGRAYFGNDWAYDEPVAAPDTPGSNRFCIVQQVIASACVDKKLVTKTREPKGGEMRDLEWDTWNTEMLSPRFQFCQIDADEPFRDYTERDGSYVLSQYDARGRNHQLIFVTQESLKRLVAELEQKQRTPELAIKAPHLSPYLQMMLEVMEAWKITSQNQPKKVSLIEEFSQRWARRFGEPLSQNLAEAMATLVRERESQQGRAAKKEKI